MTALVSLSVGGAVTGFSFVPKAAADISSPTSMPLNLLALRQSVQAPQSPQADQAPSQDAMLRAAIVHVADYYLRMAQTKSPAEMEAIIWQHDSVDQADHGQSCAAFASLTLELGAQVVGRESWVSGGSSYPWPLHSWADVRVEPNPASLGIISIQQDAEAHHRWHPLGDGYQPLPGDWVLFNGHVEVVTKDVGGVLHTVGGDSLPNFSVNAHQYPQPLSADGVVGFVNNGSLPGTAPSDPVQSGGSAQPGSAPSSAAQSGTTEARARPAKADRPIQHGGVSTGTSGLAAIPGAAPAATAQAATDPAPAAAAHGAADPAIPGLVPAPRAGSSGSAATAAPAGTGAPARHEAGGAKEDQVAQGTAAIPGLGAADHLPGKSGSAYRRHHPSPLHKPPSETRAQQAFIDAVAPGAVAAQDRYGVPAAVTIAQAIDESGWGQSQLAAQDHNLFGIKGTGPAGSVPLPTQEYVNGQQVSTSASFRVYHDVAESIDDHGRLLADSGYYQQAMANRQHPNEFAKALTGVYATDPNYGSNLISLMLRYDLYRYGTAGQAQSAHGPAGPAPGSATIPGVGGAPAAAAGPTGSAGRPTASPQPTRTHKPEPTRTASPQPTGTASPAADPDGQPGAEPDGQPGADPDRQPAAEPDSQPGADPDRQPGANSNGGTAADPDGQPAADPDRQPGADPDGQPGAQLDGQPAAQPDR